MRPLLYVGIGGGLGSILRYLLQVFAGRHIPIAFPVGTFLVNFSGCLLIGICYSLASRYAGFSPEWRLFLITGICGIHDIFYLFV